MSSAPDKPDSDTATVDQARPGEGDSKGLLGGIMDAVNQHIRDNGLEAGDALPSEHEFAETLGVSRAMVREAYRSLAAMTLIDVGNGRRARVSAPNASALALIIDHAVHIDHVTIQQIYDVRRTIEMRTVALAAMRRTDKEAALIAGHVEAMRADFHFPERVMEHDIAFHESIAEASRNPMFALVVGSFHVVTRQTWPIGWASRASDDGRAESVECHAVIAKAIAERDPRAGEVAMADHFDDSVKALLNAGIV
jgi:GntR family transcriptional regulator, transcriptional repressor for pyruvate dehydrogenase complex